MLIIHLIYTPHICISHYMCISYCMYIPHILIYLIYMYTYTCSDDIYAEDSIELLKSSGIDFEKFEKEGMFCYSVLLLVYDCLYCIIVV